MLPFRHIASRSLWQGIRLHQVLKYLDLEAKHVTSVHNPLSRSSHMVSSLVKRLGNLKEYTDNQCATNVSSQQVKWMGEKVITNREIMEGHP